MGALNGQTLLFILTQTKLTELFLHSYNTNVRILFNQIVNLTYICLKALQSNAVCNQRKGKDNYTMVCNYKFKLYLMHFILGNVYTGTTNFTGKNIFQIVLLSLTEARGNMFRLPRGIV